MKYLIILLAVSTSVSAYTPTDWSQYKYSKEYYQQKDADYQHRRKEQKFYNNNND